MRSPCYSALWHTGARATHTRKARQQHGGASRAVSTRAKDLTRARRGLWTIKRRLGHPTYRQGTLVERKVAAAVAKVSADLQATVADTPTGLTVSWRLDHARLREDAEFDGCYCLLTNLT